MGVRKNFKSGAKFKKVVLTESKQRGYYLLFMHTYFSQVSITRFNALYKKLLTDSNVERTLHYEAGAQLGEHVKNTFKDENEVNMLAINAGLIYVHMKFISDNIDCMVVLRYSPICFGSSQRIAGEDEETFAGK